MHTILLQKFTTRSFLRPVMNREEFLTADIPSSYFSETNSIFGIANDVSINRIDKWITVYSSHSSDIVGALQITVIGSLPRSSIPFTKSAILNTCPYPQADERYFPDIYIQQSSGARTRSNGFPCPPSQLGFSGIDQM